MTKDFIVRPKHTDRKEDKSVTMTIRLERGFRKNMINYQPEADAHATN